MRIGVAMPVIGLVWVLWPVQPILGGRNVAERVRAVATFTGQALRVPADAAVLLRLSPVAREYPRRSRATEGRSAASLAQGVALQFVLNAMRWLLGLFD